MFFTRYTAGAYTHSQTIGTHCIESLFSQREYKLYANGWYMHDCVHYMYTYIHIFIYITFLYVIVGKRKILHRQSAAFFT